jgi:hypothetical protein
MLDEADSRFVQDAIVKLGLRPIRDSWNDMSDGQYVVLPLELLLAHTPNLKSLQLRADHDWDLFVIPQLLKTRPAFLANLEVLGAVGMEGLTYKVSCYAIDLLTRASPNLVTLRMRGGLPRSPSRNPWLVFPPALTRLRQLELTDGNSDDPWQVARVLCAAPSLEILVLYWKPSAKGWYANHFDFDDEEDEEEGGRPKASHIWEVIDCRRDSLRELRLGSYVDCGDPGETIRRDSLADFARLERLTVDVFSLGALRATWKRNNRHAQEDTFLSKLLPPTLRELTILDDPPSMVAAMQRLASDVADGGYPNLEVVKVGLYRVWNHLESAWEDVQGELEEKFARGSVRFEIVFPDNFSDLILQPDPSTVRPIKYDTDDEDLMPDDCIFSLVDIAPTPELR